MKKGFLLSSILMIALCLSALAGATFALFTSESTTNIVISSGKVEVEASVKDVVLYSMGEQQTGTFENGGTANVEGETLSLNLLTPGDKATFKVVGENKSNVSIQYRFRVELVEGIKLAEGLKVTLGNNTYVGLSKYQSAWKTLPANAPLENLAITIELPVEAGNEYQNLNVKYTVFVEAVQGNAETTGEEKVECFDIWDGSSDDEGLTENTDQTAKVLKIESAEQFIAFAKNVNAGTNYSGWTVNLDADIYLGGKAWTPIGPNADAANKFSGTFDGQNHTIYDLYVSQGAGYHAAGLFGALNGTVKNLVINGAEISNISSGSATDNGTAVVAGSVYTSGSIDNVKVYNVKVSGNRYVGGIAGYCYGSVTNCSVEKAEITGFMDDLTGSLDNGDKVGGIAGYVGTNGDIVKIDNNYVANAEIVAARDVAGIAGVSQAISSFENNKVVESTIVYTLEKSYVAAAPIVSQRIAFTVPASNVAENVEVKKGKITYNVTNGSQLLEALKVDAEEINIVVSNSVDLALNCGIGSANTKVVNITGASKDVVVNITTASASYNGSYVTYRTVNPEAVMNFKNITLTKSAWTSTTWNTYNIEFYTDVTLTDCVINHPVTFCEKAEVKDTVINGYRGTADHYAVWVCAYADVTIEGGEINGTRAVKIDSQYTVDYTKGEHDTAETKFTISGTKIISTSTKPAILVKLEWATLNVTNVNIEGVSADKVNPVWIDEDAPTPTDKIIVKVNGTQLNNASINESVLK